MNWTVREGTLIGFPHVKNNKPNQDSFRHAINPETGNIIIAVADGAGSLEYSDMGSQIAVDAVCEFFLENDKHQPYNVEALVTQAIEDAEDVIMAHDEWKEMGCTLAVALYAHGQWCVATVGDAFAFVRHDKGLYTYISSAKNEFANRTDLLTRGMALLNITSGVDNVTHLVVSSDGLSHVSIQDGKPHEGFWEFVFSKNELELQDLFEHLNQQSKLDDDTTAIIASAMDEEYSLLNEKPQTGNNSHMVEEVH